MIPSCVFRSPENATLAVSCTKAAPEVVPFDPDQAFAHASPAFCVRLGLKLGGDGRNTSRERERKADSRPSLETILHGIANEGSDRSASSDGTMGSFQKLGSHRAG